MNGMKKMICILLICALYQTVKCQDVMINGINKNRPLSWDDFTGDPDRGSRHDANTFWNINYAFKGLSFKGDTAKIQGFSFKLSLDEKHSWVKPGKQSDALLKHEQGHFDLGLLCQQEMIKQFSAAVFTRANFQEQVQKLFNSVLEKYRLMGVKYDSETDHSKNQVSQDSWNNFFATELKR
jgi:Bacterial protein of unknown function (DUF922)